MLTEINLGSEWLNNYYLAILLIYYVVKSVLKKKRSKFPQEKKNPKSCHLAESLIYSPLYKISFSLYYKSWEEEWGFNAHLHQKGKYIGALACEWCSPLSFASACVCMHMHFK